MFIAFGNRVWKGKSKKFSLSSVCVLQFVNVIEICVLSLWC